MRRSVGCLSIVLCVSLAASAVGVEGAAAAVRVPSASTPRVPLVVAPEGVPSGLKFPVVTPTRSGVPTTGVAVAVASPVGGAAPAAKSAGSTSVPLVPVSDTRQPGPSVPAPVFVPAAPASLVVSGPELVPGVMSVPLGSVAAASSFRSVSGGVSAVSVSGAGLDGGSVDVAVVDAVAAKRVSPIGWVFGLSFSAAGASSPQLAGKTKPTSVSVDVDYSAHASDFGASFGERLTVVALSPCALLSPVPVSCDLAPELVSVTNDHAGHRLRVALTDVQAARMVGAPTATAGGGVAAALINAAAITGGGAKILAVQSSVSGPSGSFAASALSTVTTYQTGLFSGTAEAGISIPVPPSPTGVGAPSVSLGYSSGAVDGMNTAKNDQPGWGGIGWSMEFGSITRHLPGCVGISAAPGDLCSPSVTDPERFTISLNGKGAKLVQSSSNADDYRLYDDPSWKVTRMHSSDPVHAVPDAQGDFWVVTTPDGTKYTFGRFWETSAASNAWKPNNSAFWVPVYSPTGTGRGWCGATSTCQKVWQWNIDRIEDTNGNVTSFFYDPELNAYRPFAKQTYWHGGNVSKIEYGKRVGSETVESRARVLFNTEDRCAVAGCPDRTAATYPDTPWDLYCDPYNPATACTLWAPSFFTTRRLASVQTQVADNPGVWRTVDQYTLNHSWPIATQAGDPVMSEKKMQLDSIDRLASSPGLTSISIRVMSAVYTNLANRAFYLAHGWSAMWMARLTSVVNELGGTTQFAYGGGEAGCADTYTFFADNHLTCAPAWDSFSSPQGWEAFTRYNVISRKVYTADPATTGVLSGQEQYAYGPTAWHYSDTPELPVVGSCTCATNFWNDFRGYQFVDVSNPSATNPSYTRHYFYQGMNLDRADQAGNLKSVSGVGPTGPVGPDDNQLRGREIATYSAFGASFGSGLEASRSQTTWSYLPSAQPGFNQLSFRVMPIVNRTSKSGFALDPASNVVLKTRVETDFDEFLNATKTRVYDDSSNSLLSSSETTYLNTSVSPMPTSWIVNRPSATMKWAAGSPNPLQKSEVAYDNQAFGATPIVGNATATKVWLDRYGTQTAASTVAYDSYGRACRATDAMGKSVTTTFDPTWGYAARSDLFDVTVGCGAQGTHYSTVSGYEPGRGTVGTSTDTNGRVSTSHFDSLGRFTDGMAPGDTWTSAVADYLLPAAGAYGRVHSSTLRDQNAPTKYVDSYGYVDGLGRTVQTQTPSQNAGKMLVTSTDYDPSTGGVWHQSAQYELTGAAGSGYVAPTWTSIGRYGENKYDAAGRVTASIAMYNLTEQSRSRVYYNGNSTMAIDALGHAKATIVNAAGQTLQTVEYTGTATASTVGTLAPYANMYFWVDEAGRTVQSSDPKAKLTTIVYDAANRKVGLSDPDLGWWTYTYRPDGQIQSQTENAGFGVGAPAKTVWFEYDSWGRQIRRRKDSASGAIIAESTYDNSNTGSGGNFGAMLSATSYTLDGTIVQSNTGFDAKGRVTNTQWNVPGILGGTYQMSSAMNNAGQVLSQRYPAGPNAGLGETVTSAYNTIGQPVTVTGTQQYATGATYDQTSALTNLTFGTGQLYRTRSYDPATGRLSALTAGTTSGATNQQNLSFTYDIGGRTTKIVDGINANQRECFRYDDLNRLTGAFTGDAGCTTIDSTTGTQTYTDTYNYDTVGNITSNATQTYSYGATEKPSTIIASNWTSMDEVIRANDMDSDGKPDVIARSGGTLYLYAGNGTGGFKTSGVVIGTGFSSYKVVGVADWNGDGKQDLLATDSSGGLWMYPGTGTGTIGGPVGIGVGWNVFSQVMATPDMNGDGKADIIAIYGSGAGALAGNMLLYPGNGTGGFTGVNTTIGTGWNTFSHVYAPGDVTGDGSADILGQRPSGVIVKFRGNGAGGWISGTEEWFDDNFNGYADVVFPGDWNGDGKFDVITRSGGQVELWKGLGASNGGEHAARQMGTNRYLYDSAGNQVSRTIGGVTQTLVYDYDQRLTVDYSSATHTRSSYDTGGQRVLRSDGKTVTLSLPGYERSTSQLAQDTSFENPAMWTGSCDAPCAGTSTQIGSRDTASPHTGVNGISVSNVADGGTASAAFAVTAGQAYTATVYVKGWAPSTDTVGHLELRWDWMNSSSVIIGTSALVNVQANTLTNSWVQKTIPGTPAAGATQGVVSLYARGLNGWVAFDDASAKRNGVATELLATPGFETATNWTSIVDPSAPATSSRFASSGEATPRTGSGEWVVSNWANTTSSSAAMNVTAGSSYQMNVWLRGWLAPDVSSKYTVSAQWLNASNAVVSTAVLSTATSATLTAVYASKGATVVAPAGATKAQMIINQNGSGVVAFDDASVKLVGSSTELLSDPGFEGGGWTTVTNPAFPASAPFYTGAASNAAVPRTGFKALALSNRAAGSVTSQEFLVSPGVSYTAGAWFRSNINQDAFGHWKIRVAYTDLNGTSVANVDVGTSSAPTSSWTNNSGVTVAPANAYKARLVVRALDVGGWVNVDDISMAATGITPAVTTTSYYTLGAASVAFRQQTAGQADKVFFTVGDQVGGVSVTYRSDGGQTTSQRYRPFGAPRTTSGTNTLPTDHSFIGQVADISAGLVYLNHRYYDPALARFISVDPLVAKTGEAYTYAGNNPITFSDPSGLCAADTNGAREACSAAKGAVGPGPQGLSTGDEAHVLMSKPAGMVIMPGITDPIELIQVWNLTVLNWASIPLDPVLRFGDSVSANSVACVGLDGCHAAVEYLAKFNHPTKFQVMKAKWLALHGGVIAGDLGASSSNTVGRRQIFLGFIMMFAMYRGGLGVATNTADDFVDLASPARRTHILDGDATGGGHLWPGNAGKTPFPQGWSGDKIMHEVSDIATDPIAWQNAVPQGSRTVLTGTRGGVDIRVIVDTNSGEIISGYPTNLPRNP